MSKNFFFYLLKAGVSVCFLALGCTRALPTRDEQAGINQALAKAETQARLAKQYADESVRNRQEAARYLEQAREFLSSALRMQELCKKRAQPSKCVSKKKQELEKTESAEAKKAEEQTHLPKADRQADSAVTPKKEQASEPSTNLNDLDYAPSDAPPGVYEKLNKGK